MTYKCKFWVCSECWYSSPHPPKERMKYYTRAALEADHPIMLKRPELVIQVEVDY